MASSAAICRRVSRTSATSDISALFSKKTIFLGCLSFADARSVQEQAVLRCQSDGNAELLLICEHPPTLSLGRRTLDLHLGLSLSQWESMGVEVVAADRGGSVTYHGPGQLVIYPVLSLRRRRLGVKRFVEAGLGSIAAVLNGLGMEAFVSLDRTGVWVVSEELRSSGNKGERKICSVGLRVRCGVTDHGFALNVGCDMTPFRRFSPCGFSGQEMTSIEQETGRTVSAVETAGLVAKSFWKCMGIIEK